MMGDLLESFSGMCEWE